MVDDDTFDGNAAGDLPFVPSDAVKARLAADPLLAEFKQNKLELDASRNWDKFYLRNSTNFFKDRHWTRRELEGLCPDVMCSSSDVDDPTCMAARSPSLTFLEVGCGVGNLLYPLLREYPDSFMNACDFSPRAVEFVKSHADYNVQRCNVFRCDLTTDKLRQNVSPESVDIATIVFVLSAIHPDYYVDVLRNIYDVLKPSGSVVLRDYGIYDHAMLRFSSGHKLGENFYVRQDGTRAYYFRRDEVEGLFGDAGFRTCTSQYVSKETINRKKGVCVPRVFVQGRFVKS